MTSARTPRDAPPDGPPAAPPDAPPDAPPETAPETAGRPPAPGPPSPRPAGRDGWRPWTAWAALLTGFGVTIMCGLAVAIVSSAVGVSVTHPPHGVTIGLTFFQDCALIGAALFFAHMAGRPWPRDFGLRRPGADAADGAARRAALRRAFGLLLAVWVGFYAFSAVWVAALSLNERQTLPDDLGVGGSTLNLLLVVFLITIVAPLGEELFFRGYFFASLRNWRGVLPAAVVTGVVFGAIHIGSAPIGFTVPLGVFGFGLCLLYQRTGSLLPGIALHALNNSVALGLTQHWSWEILPTMVVAVTATTTIAVLLARTLERRASAGVGPLAQPAS